MSARQYIVTQTINRELVRIHLTASSFSKLELEYAKCLHTLKNPVDIAYLKLKIQYNSPTNSIVSREATCLHDII